MAVRFMSALCALFAFSVPAIAASVQGTPPRNIIMVVGDGMGPAYTTAYRYFKDEDLNDGIDRTIFDSFLVGSASTFPAPESGLVTDSAAGATALSTGVKSYNGAIAMDVNRQPLHTVMREAKRLGMRTGLAVTSQIVHATPASYVTHNVSRQNYDEIANHFFDDKIRGQFVADVMLGGGTSFFKREDRDIVSEFIDAGYQYADNYQALNDYPAGQNILGLFAPVGLPWALDDSKPHRLSFLAKHAIKHLENDKGFFLLVEGSQVDWGGHANDIASAMAEMDDLSQTIIMLSEYVKQNPDTLVVLTADHSTGGLTLGAKGDYRWDPKWIRQLKSSATHMSQQIILEQKPVHYIESQLGFELNEDEKAGVMALLSEQDQRKRSASIKRIIDDRTNTGWTTGGHTGVDVPVFAMGAGAEHFAGSLNNTDIGKKIFSFLAELDTQINQSK